MKLLPLCAALAAGEAIAACLPEGAEAWPVALIAAVLIAFFGYGRAWTGWRYAFIFLLGVILFFHASLESERNFRDRPWMRGLKTREKTTQRVPTAVYNIRQDMSRRIGLGLEHNPDVTTLNRAILLGDRRHMPKDLKRAFIDSGTIHVFAISGLHVMIIVNVLLVMLLLAFIPLRFAGLLVVPLIWGYIYLIGMPPSAVRAGMMASFSCLAPVFWRRPDGLTAWSLTFLLVHVFEPQLITHVGNLLSFTVMLAIMLTGYAIADWKSPILRKIAIGFAAWASGVPIVAHVFGQITPGGLLANFIMLPAASYSVGAGAIGVMTSFVSETLARHINNFSALFTSLMVTVSQAVASIPGANIHLPSMPIWQCLLWYIALGLSLILAKRRHAPI